MSDEGFKQSLIGISLLALLAFLIAMPVKCVQRMKESGVRAHVEKTLEGCRVSARRRAAQRVALGRVVEDIVPLVDFTEKTNGAFSVPALVIKMDRISEQSDGVMVDLSLEDPKHFASYSSVLRDGETLKEPRWLGDKYEKSCLFRVPTDEYQAVEAIRGDGSRLRYPEGYWWSSDCGDGLAPADIRSVIVYSEEQSAVVGRYGSQFSAAVAERITFSVCVIALPQKRVVACAQFSGDPPREINVSYAKGQDPALHGMGKGTGRKAAHVAADQWLDSLCTNASLKQVGLSPYF